MMSLRAAWPLWNNASPASNDDAASQNNQTPIRLEPAAFPAFDAALDRAIRDRLDAFLTGLAAYRTHPYRPTPPRLHRLWRAGTTKLMDYGGAGRPVLFVPSLVNGPEILDLTPASGLLRWLRGRGVRPLLLCWNRPGPVERRFSIACYLQRRLVPALARAAGLAGGPVPVVGYCMGGTLAVALTTLAPHRVSRLALLAAPWDFHAGQADIAPTLARLGPRFIVADRTGDSLPHDAIQTLFWALDPLQAMRKFAAFARQDPDSGAARRFVALEDWLNGGIPLAGPAARDCFTQWYGANLPARNAWVIDSRAIDPRRLSQPALLAIPGRDRIVPPASAAALAAALPAARRLDVRLGHIGMIASRHARTQIWNPLRDWLTA